MISAMSMSLLRTFFMMVIAILAAACGSQKPADHAEDPDPLVCAANWQVIFSPQQSTIASWPKVLRWNNGRLFTSLAPDNPSRILSFPDTGGPASTLLEGATWSFWIEDERLLYAGGGTPTEVDGFLLAPTLLFSMPIAGGPSEVVLTTHIWDKFLNQLPGDWALDRDALYWARRDFTSDGGNSLTAWRGLRNGGGDQNLSTLASGQNLPLLDPVLLPLTDHLLVYGGLIDSDTIYSLPKSGGEATQLPTWPAGKVIGVSNDGTALFRRYTGGASAEKRSERFEVGRLLPGAAAVEPFWPGKPASAYPFTAWDDGQGGFYVDLWEWGTDDAIHMTIWAVGADGLGQRLACDPVVLTTVSAAAVAPDGIYVVVLYENFYWEIAKIARAR
jgi:hypothetical protein